MPPPLKRIVPNPLRTQALIKPHKTLIRRKLEGKECPVYVRKDGYIYTLLVGHRLYIYIDGKATAC